MFTETSSGQVTYYILSFIYRVVVNNINIKFWIPLRSKRVVFQKLRGYRHDLEGD